VIKLACILMILIVQIGCGFPSDRELENRFYEYRTDFEALGRMLVEDRDVVVLNDETVFYNGDMPKTISSERLGDYRGLLRKLGIGGGISRDSDGSANLIVSYKGVLIRSSGKGYYYSTGSVTPVVESLDEVIRNEIDETRPTFKRIEGNWYLVYESW
jgi:hypothetical protein